MQPEEIAASRARLLVDLRTSVETLTDEVTALREDIKSRPTQTEVTKQRHIAVVRVVVVVLWFVLIATMVQDGHSEVCGTGARAEKLIDALVQNKIHTAVDFRNEATRGRPGWCDVVFPIHTHDRGDWPSSRNVQGMIGYGILGAASLVVTRPRSWERHRTKAEVQATAAEIEP